jgi:hypothetical protein
MKKATTTTTADELQAMADGEFLAHLRRFAYPSQWGNPAAWQYAELRLAHLNGARYVETGKLESFTNSIR